MLLSCRNLTLKYPHNDHPVLENLCFEITSPGLHALFGHSGAGKTSLARLITGELPHSDKFYSGEIKIRNMETLLYSYNTERLPGWSAISHHLDKITPASRKTQKDDLITLFGLETCMDQPFNRLSLGQKNRINLVRYLVQDFDLLVMDESLANVDERTREKIILRIKDMFPDTYFLYISHNVIEVSKFCREILVFRNPRKLPQVLTVNGQDHKLGQSVAKDQLEQIMLEIMHAS